MKQTNRFKGQIYKLLDQVRHISYRASFDITAHTTILDKKRTAHIAFTKNMSGKVVVTMCQENHPLVIYNHTRTLTEILSGKSENPYDHDVFPQHFINTLAKLGLSQEEYQQIVGDAYEQVGVI